MKSFKKNWTFTTEKYIASQADRLINTWNEINYSFQQSNTEKSRLHLAEWPSGQSNQRATCATGTKYSILLTPAGVPVNISVGRDGHLLYPTLYSGLWLVDQYMRWNIIVYWFVLRKHRIYLGSKLERLSYFFLSRTNQYTILSNVISGNRNALLSSL